MKKIIAPCEPHKLANNYLKNYYGTENYFLTTLKNFFYTDGVKAMADKFECHWLISDIVIYQLAIVKDHPDVEFQEWIFQKNDDNTGILKCFTERNQEGGCIFQHVIPLTDFPGSKTSHKHLTTAIVWVQNNVMHLPSEY